MHPLQGELPSVREGALGYVSLDLPARKNIIAIFDIRNLVRSILSIKCIFKKGDRQ